MQGSADVDALGPGLGPGLGPAAGPGEGDADPLALGGLMGIGGPPLGTPGLVRQLTEGSVMPKEAQVGRKGGDAAADGAADVPPPAMLMIGTGQYTAGDVPSQKEEEEEEEEKEGRKTTKSDKGKGVVALTMFDLRARGKVGPRLALCGTRGVAVAAARRHLEREISRSYEGLDTTLETFPPEEAEARDTQAYRAAVETFARGDCATVFTPDDTHYAIASHCVENGMHVLVTKPVVKTLEDHVALANLARERGVLVAVEVHKRWDPMYADARDRIQALGPFNYFYSYMSQPKSQLDTFRAWAGKSSDISYYLNSHHIDFHEWCMGDRARPVRVTAAASTGVAHARDIETEDSITLTVLWENLAEDGRTASSIGTAVYTSSWVAPGADVHSQQRFFYMGQRGEINIDQAHRGYTAATDSTGFGSVNPLFMKYTPTNGKFAGQQGYGYRSFEAFVDAAGAINRGAATPSDFGATLATIDTTIRTTAVLHAGRQSLDANGQSIEIVYGDVDRPTVPTSLRPCSFAS